MIDLTAISGNITALAEKLSHRQSEAKDTLQTLSALMRRADTLSDGASASLLARWKEPKVIAARPVESPTVRTPLPQRPPVLTLCASDGSQLFPDRNLNLEFFVLNLSRIAFHIGTREFPVMESKTEFYDDDFAELLGLLENEDDLVLPTVELITALRQQRELETLYDLALEQRQAGRPVLALADGTLICWHLLNLREPLRHKFIVRYTETLAKFRAAEIPVASYVSFPGSKEVRGTLGILLRPELSESGVSLARLDDQLIFGNYLERSQRSALFASRSEDILRFYDDRDAVFFFYLHTGREIARIEFPAWAAPFADLFHATLFDDAAKGGGYPMTLTEAHEQAALGHSDQQMIYQMIERAGNREGFPVTYSAKLLSKRTARI